MRSTPLRFLGAVALSTLAVAAGCTDRGNITEPTAAVSGPTVSRSLLTPIAVSVVTRNVPLATAQTVSATIGILGGTLVLPGAGLTVVVPPLALTSAKRLTVRALAGNQVAYEFEPHGTHFLVPLLVTQKLSGTSAVSGGLFPQPVVAGYFADLTALDPLGGTGLVSELLGVTLNLLTKTATFPVFHFSGYLVASGQDAADALEGGY